MARLDWNPIALADIGESAIRAQALAGRSIQDAFGALKGVVGSWENDRRQDVLRNVAQQQLMFSDPDAYREAMKTGAIPMQSDYLTPEDLMKIGGYQDVLVDRRNAEADYDQGQTRFANEQTVFADSQEDRATRKRERDAFNAAYPEMLGVYAEAERTGDASIILPRLREIAIARNLNAEQQQQFMEQGFSYAQEGRSRESHALNQEKGRFDLDTGRTEFSHREDDRVDARQAETLEALVIQLAGVNKDDPVALEAAMRQAIDGGGFNTRVVGQISAKLGIAAPIDVLAGMNGGTGNGARGDSNYNQGNVRDVGQFAGQPGYLGPDEKGFARFATAEAGANVSTNQLRLYMNGQSRNVPEGGIRTIQQIVNTWAPVGPENSAESVRNYVKYVSDRLGVASTADLTEADIPRLAIALGEFENGRPQRGVLTADAATRWGPANTNNAAQLRASGDAAANRPGADPNNPLRMEMANPTAFITLAESTLGRASNGLSQQGGATGIDAAANYDRTQATQRDPGVAVADALGKDGFLAGSGMSARELTNAVAQLKRDVPSLTSDTALRVLADARTGGNGFTNSFGQMTGNVHAAGNGVYLDMVRASQIARSLGNEGGAELRENARNVQAGQARLAQVQTTFQTTLDRYKASAAQDAERLAPGQISTQTRAYAEQIIRLNDQIDSLTATAARNAQSYAGGRGAPQTTIVPQPQRSLYVPPAAGPQRSYAPGRAPAPVAPVAQQSFVGGGGPPLVVRAAPTPQQQVQAREARRAITGTTLNRIIPGAGWVMNQILDRRERTFRGN